MLCNTRSNDMIEKPLLRNILGSSVPICSLLRNLLFFFFFTMIWSNLLPPRDENKRAKWGYEFQWTENHLTADQTNPLRFSYDRLGEQALERLRLIQSSAAATSERDSKVLKPRLDLYTLLQENYKNDEILEQLWKEVNTVPDWVDWEQLAREQEVFYRYAIPGITGFVLQGFVGETSVRKTAYS